MAKESKQDRVYRVFERIADGYDRANNRISLGMQRDWKRMLLRHMTSRLRCSADVLDVCCGTGDISIGLADALPGARITGIDFSPAMLKVAESKGGDRENITWMQGNALALPFGDNRFDAACISFGLRNTENYEQVLREMRRVVRPGGWVYCLDSFVPENPLVVPFYRLYFHGIMPLIGGGKKRRSEYNWLWESTDQFLSRRELMVLFHKVGLTRVGGEGRLMRACVLVEGRKPKQRRSERHKS